MLRGLKHTLCAPRPRGPTETETELCLSVSCGGTCQQWTPTGTGFSGCRRPGYGISPLGRGRHRPHHRAARTYTGLGKQTLGWHKQNFVHTRTQEKGAMTPQETDPDLPIRVLESPAEACVSDGLLKSRGTECSSVSMGLLKEVNIIFITSTIV